MPSLPQTPLDLTLEVACMLAQKGLIMATAESCTGGGIGAELTALPGSSSWFVGGIISYSNSAKHRLLKVPLQILEDHGAVSRAVAEAMAIGGCYALQADLCVAVTGVAGPGGGSAEKPVGQVWIAWAQADKQVSSCRYEFGGNRKNIRQQTIEHALMGLLEGHLPCLRD